MNFNYDHNNYLVEQQIGYNNGWQQSQVAPLHYTVDYVDLPPPSTWTYMNNEKKAGQEHFSQILKTALTHGSAVAIKNYTADISAHITAPNNNPINSTTPNNQFSQDWNTQAERDSLCSSSSSQNQKSMPTTCNSYLSPEWNTQYSEADLFSSLSPNHQQPTIPVTYNNSNNNNLFSREWNNFHTGRIESIDPSSNMTSHESLERHEQQNIQNNYGQTHNLGYVQFSNYMNNTCIGPLTVTNPEMQFQSMQRNIRLIDQISKRDHKKKKITCIDNTLEQGRRTRQTYSAEQTLILEEAFRKNEYVSRKMRMILADRTELSGNQIKTWFQNRRMKEKKNRENNPEKVPKTYVAPIHGRQVSTLLDQEAQLQLRPVVQHYEGYQNYSHSH
ncbi:homeobox protein Hox-D10a-like [Linepithema humile]|uniref:homeobox protein Hox-D10a-like n=1 Tax=Linepithema humile TaxID=83485 RepID=UPI00062398FE|nr:PREDICTED: homeobox protein Hox-B4-like [Linepithema humile]